MNDIHNITTSKTTIIRLHSYRVNLQVYLLSKVTNMVGNTLTTDVVDGESDVF